MIRIRPIDANDQVIEATLDDQLYFLGLSWNPSGEFWTLTVRDANNALILGGLPLRLNWPMTLHHRHRGVPRGELVAIGTALDRTSFLDDRSMLLYVSYEELAAEGYARFYGGG